jgi:hypothetical protein
MKNTLIASLLAASIVSIAAPAFASGFGPAPSYTPSTGAPASQRGPSVLTLDAQTTTGANAYGGSADGHASGGVRAASESPATVFAHH